MNARETAKNITEQGINLFTGQLEGATITNEIFLVIQNHKGLMQQYLRAVEEFGLDSINQSIGHFVKELYSLEDDGNKRENNPSSTLISSHQKFK